MKIKIFAILLLCTFSLQSIAQNNDSTLYSSLEFDNGIAVKDVVVDFKSFGKDPATINARDSLIAAINKSIMLSSNTALEFDYNNEHYYIGLHNRCKQETISLWEKKNKNNVESIKIMITIAFFENVYYRGLPYAVVIDIKQKY